MKPNSAYFPDTSESSSAQHGFLESLLRDLAGKRIYPDAWYDAADLNMGQTGLVITCLKEVRKISAPEEYKITLFLRDYMEKVSKLENVPEDKTLKVEYILSKNI